MNADKLDIFRNGILYDLAILCHRVEFNLFGTASNKGGGLKIPVVGAANGLVSILRSESSIVYHCVALNRELEARGDSKQFALASPFSAAILGLTGVEHPSFRSRAHV